MRRSRATEREFHTLFPASGLRRMRGGIRCGRQRGRNGEDVPGSHAQQLWGFCSRVERVCAARFEFDEDRIAVSTGQAVNINSFGFSGRVDSGVVSQNALNHLRDCGFSANSGLLSHGRVSCKKKRRLLHRTGWILAGTRAYTLPGVAKSRARHVRVRAPWYTRTCPSM